MINDPVDMVVAFEANRVVPRAMRWNRRVYTIKNVNLVHSTHEGNKRVFYFSVSDLTNYFKLKLDPEMLEWRLVEMYADG